MIAAVESKESNTGVSLNAIYNRFFQLNNSKDSFASFASFESSVSSSSCSSSHESVASSFDDDSVYESDTENNQLACQSRSSAQNKKTGGLFQSGAKSVGGKSVRGKSVIQANTCGSGPVQYMIAAPSSSMNYGSILLSPSYLKSVSVKKGLSDGNTKKLFQVRSKQKKEKQWTKVHPKQLEKKCDQYKEKYMKKIVEYKKKRSNAKAESRYDDNITKGK